jgi:hypothetical protein
MAHLILIGGGEERRGDERGGAGEGGGGGIFLGLLFQWPNLRFPSLV